MAKQFDAIKTAKILALVLGSPSPGERASARHTLIRMLGGHGITGPDLLPRHYLDRSDAAVVEAVNDLLHPLWGEDDAACEQHRAFVERRLIRYRLGWSDLDRAISEAAVATRPSWRWGRLKPRHRHGANRHRGNQCQHPRPDRLPRRAVCGARSRHSQLVVPTQPAVGAAHTHVYDRYMCSPQRLLAVCGPMPNVGKTTTFDVLGKLVLRPWRAARSGCGSCALQRHGRQSHHDADRRDALCRFERPSSSHPARGLPSRDGSRSAWPNGRLMFSAPLGSVSSAAAQPRSYRAGR